MLENPDLGTDGPATARRTYRLAEFRGNIVARQACEPLEALHERGQLTDAQYEAGRMLRTYLAGSWPASRCTTRWGVASDAGDLDDDDAPHDETEAWHQREEFHARWREAEALMGARCWVWVRPVLEGGWPGSQFRADIVREGLGVLARAWRL